MNGSLVTTIVEIGDDRQAARPPLTQGVEAWNRPPSPWLWRYTVSPSTTTSDSVVPKPVASEPLPFEDACPSVSVSWLVRSTDPVRVKSSASVDESVATSL